MVSVGQFNRFIFCIVFCYCFGTSQSLTGHVCTRERAEIYMLSYNQAFICQERYTTSCGHLDWRRCTRYRVQTCYTPHTKYATRYKQVEECCLGWTQDGTGSCSIPMCPHLCQNGGSCTESGGVPGCECQDGYSGEACQHVNEGEWKSYYSVIIISVAIVMVAVLVVFGYKWKKRIKSSPTVIPSNTENQDRSSDIHNRIFFTTGSNSGRWAIPTEHGNVYPSAPNG